MGRFSRRTFLAGAPVLMAGGLALADTNKGAEPDMDPDIIEIPANYYQHFDADFELSVPEENFGGWRKEALPFSRSHTALVVMHAWDAGTYEQFPGWWRAVPYIPRANTICETIMPRLLEAVRASGFNLFHVVGGGDYYRDLPGYKHALELAGPTPPKPEPVPTDPTRDKLAAFRDKNVFVGKHNADDVRRGFERLDFAPNTRPRDDEGIAENGHQLAALCRERGVNHLVYTGFAINWCLLLSPGGMAEMCHTYGVMCSAIRQATTAVENKASARDHWGKELALWRVALAFGFVFDLEDFLQALKPAG